MYLIIRISLVNWQIMLPFRSCSLDAWPLLDSTGKLLPPGPDSSIAVLLVLGRNRRDVLEVLEDPHAHSPWCNDEVNHGRFGTHEIWSFLVHLLRELLDMVSEVLAGFLQALIAASGTTWLMLEEAVEAWNDSTCDIILPDPHSSPVIKIFGKQVGTVAGIGFLKKLADDVGLIQWLFVEL